MQAKSLQSCPTLYDPMDCSPPGPSVHGILQASVLEWVAIPFSRLYPLPSSKAASAHTNSCYSSIHFSVPKSVLISLSSKSLQSCPTLCTVAHQAPLSMGIFQARILDWVAMPSSMGSSQPRDWTCISYISCIGRWVLYHQRHLGSPWAWAVMTKDVP